MPLVCGMKIQSLARKTDLIFAKHNGEVLQRVDYLVIRTPSNPTYHWGNYLLFKDAPSPGDEIKWRELFKREFQDISGIQHELFVWDIGSEQNFDSRPFLNLGFEIDEGVTLSCEELVIPPKYRSDLALSLIVTDEEWEQVLKLQVLCGDPKYAKGYESFKREQMKNYRQMHEKGLGHWWGVWENNTLVADLGLFFEGDVGRYQSVGTHPEFRRQGLCQSLVYQAGKLSQEKFKLKTLVMEADFHYHAAKIYESVGFLPVERTYSLSRYQKE